MARMIHLPKTVLALKGSPRQFMGDFCSNTYEALHNAFLDVRGCIVATFDHLTRDERESWLVLEKEFSERLKKHLQRYLELNNCDLKDTPLSVYYDLDSNHKPQANEFVIPQRQGQLIITSQKRPSSVKDDEFTLFRVRSQIPMQGTDYDREMLLNISMPEYVSFEKGCYLGQEIIARVHHRGRAPKRLVVRRQSECTAGEFALMSSKIKDPESGEIMGFVFAKQAS